jgi:preprotein translocase subunit SecE
MAKQNPARTAPRPPSRPAPATGRGPSPAATRPGTPSRFAGLQRGFRDTLAELRKVQWPDRTTTRNLTLVVIAMSTALAVVLGAFDYVLTMLVEWLIRLNS